MLKDKIWLFFKPCYHSSLKDSEVFYEHIHPSAQNLTNLVSLDLKLHNRYCQHCWKNINKSYVMFHNYLNFQIYCSIKSQLILKGHFVFFNSSKRRKKKICHSRLCQKFEFSSSFFGRIEDTKNTFRN